MVDENTSDEKDSLGVEPAGDPIPMTERWDRDDMSSGTRVFKSVEEAKKARKGRRVYHIDSKTGDLVSEVIDSGIDEGPSNVKESTRHYIGKHDQSSHGNWAGPGGGIKGGSGTKDDPYVIDDIKVAAKELAAGNYVELEQERSVSTLIDELAREVEEATKEGKEATNIDLCKVSVKGTNLFCQESKGIARLDMPQFSTKNPIKGSYADQQPRTAQGEVDLAEDYVAHLKNDLGVEVTSDELPARYFRATQNELSGIKVAGITGALEKGGKEAVWGSVFVSKDDYVVDGHHRWAAFVAQNARDPDTSDDIPLSIRRIDLDIGTILTDSSEWTRKVGIPGASWKAHRSKRPSKRVFNLDDWGKFTVQGVTYVEDLNLASKLRLRHYIGKHDQSSHGNWAEGLEADIARAAPGTEFVGEQWNDAARLDAAVGIAKVRKVFPGAPTVAKVEIANPDSDDETSSKLGEAFLALGDETIAGVHPLDPESRIFVRPEFTDAKYMEDEYLKVSRDNPTASMSITREDIIVHEYGHVMENKIMSTAREGGEFRPAVLLAANSLEKYRNSKGVEKEKWKIPTFTASGYGLTSPQEWNAEHVTRHVQDMTRSFKITTKEVVVPPPSNPSQASWEATADVSNVMHLAFGGDIYDEDFMESAMETGLASEKGLLAE